jgi:glutathione S-transferase
MMHPILPALVTGLALVLYLVVTTNVSRARGRYGIKAPAVTGHEGFERAYRVQMNTLESFVFFLPALWLAALFYSPLVAALLGLIWVIGRTWYAWAYYRDPARRGPPFVVSAIAAIALLVIGFIGVLTQLSHTGLLIP